MKKPLTLRDFMIVLLSHWKAIVLCAIIFALLGSGVMEVLRERGDAKTITEMELNNLRALYAQADALDSSLALLEERVKDSMFMSLTPGGGGESTVTFYVETGYQIMPELMYQNPDKREDIVSAFTNAYMTNTALTSDLTALLPDMTRDGIFELIQVTAVGNFIVEIRSFHSDKAVAEKMTGLVFDHMNAQILKSIAEYEAKIISASTSEIMDGTLIEAQSKYVDRLNEQRKRTETARNEVFAAASSFLKMKSDPAENMQAIGRLLDNKSSITYLNTQFSITTLIKNIILFGIVGLLLAYTAAVLSYVMDMRIRYADDVIRLYHLSVLGVVPDESKNRRLFAKTIRKLQEVDLEGETAADAYALIGESIRLMNPREERRIALVSSCGREPAEAAEKGLHDSCRAEAAGDVLRSAQAATILSQADAVVLVEVRGRSSAAQIQVLRQRIDDAGKQMLGVILQ